MPYAICPGCDENMFIPNKPQLGQHVICRECEAELEVVSVNPLEVDWPFEDDDGYDYEDEDEYEYDEDE